MIPSPSLFLPCPYLPGLSKAACGEHATLFFSDNTDTLVEVIRRILHKLPLFSAAPGLGCLSMPPFGQTVTRQSLMCLEINMPQSTKTYFHKFIKISVLNINITDTYWKKESNTGTDCNVGAL